MSKGLKACRGIHLALHSQPFILYHQPRLLICYYLIYTFNKSRSTTSSIWPRDNKLAIINDNESMIHSSLDAIYVWIILFASLVNNNHCNYGKVEYIYIYILEMFHFAEMRIFFYKLPCAYTLSSSPI